MNTYDRACRIADTLTAAGIECEAQRLSYGSASQYLTVVYRDYELVIRVSDHRQPAGGGHRYNEATGEYEQTGDADVHYLRGDGKRTDDVVKHLDAAVDEAIADDAARAAYFARYMEGIKAGMSNYEADKTARSAA